MTQAKTLAMVALGANLPFKGEAPERSLRAALDRLCNEIMTVQLVSKFYRTPCFPLGAGPDYVNAAAVIECSAEIDATSLMQLLHQIEAEFGRERATRWGMRTLDLDLLAMGESVVPDNEVQDRWRALPPDQQARVAPDQLILPHPRLQDRAFVLVPLADIAPDWVHPRTGHSVAMMLAALPQADRDAMVPMPSTDGHCAD